MKIEIDVDPQTLMETLDDLNEADWALDADGYGPGSGPRSGVSAAINFYQEIIQKVTPIEQK